MTTLDLALHKQQTKAFQSEATEILYGGAAGGGKSHLMRVLAIMLCMSIPGLLCGLFRRLSDDLKKNHMEGPGGFYKLLEPLLNSGHAKYNDSKSYIEFWNGSKIFLCHCQYEKDRFKYQGQEFHLLLIDELTHFTETIYRYLRGRCRLGGLKIPEEYKNRLPLIICGSNPGGVGHNWVKSSFIDISAAMQVKRMEKKEGGMLRQYIPAKLDDNPTLLENDPDYIDRLEGLGDPALVAAMKSGDWDIVSGGALDDVWSRNKHVINRFKIPSSWRIDRAFDWGSTHPFSVGWFAECDGTEAELNGKTFCPPRGSLILINEWYGANGPNKGLKLSSTEIAEGIKEREAELVKSGFFPKKPLPGPADNQISNVNDKSSDSIARKMAKKGIKWKESEKKPGSRKNGLELLRDMMKETKKDHPEGPSFYIMEHCTSAIAHLPVLPRSEKDPEDVDTDAEDHDYDMIRYRVLASNKRTSRDLKVSLPT